ncbi:MAG TPA: hypothetical protein PKN32_13015 [Bacteroidales bacterium]|nr:hypothetical protein [Bacteroidales bacterium]
MTNIIDLKEKLKNISDFLEKIESKGFSKIERDILLQMLRDYYLEVSEISRKDNVIEPVASFKITETENAQLSEEITEAEKIDNIDLDFIDNSDDTKPSIPENSETVETSPKNEEPKQEEIKKETHSQQTVKKIVAEQTSLFGSNNQVGVKTVGEKLGQNKTSVNELLGQKTNPSDISGRLKPVSDIKSAIGVGDRFLFVRELFAGNGETFEETVAHLNSLSSFEDAHNYLNDKFKWDGSQSTVASFLNIVKRRYV